MLVIIYKFRLMYIIFINETNPIEYTKLLELVAFVITFFD